MRLIQQGPRDAKVVIVGESPAVGDMARGYPFSAGAGEVLDRMLDRCGLPRAGCFLTNIVHSPPPGKSDFEYFLKPAQAAHLTLGLVQLRQDILTIRPNLVIALGQYPLKFLTGKSGIAKWRGSVLEGSLAQGTKVLGTYHPAAILRIWDYKAVAEFDLAKAAREATHPEIIRTKRNLILNPPHHEREALYRELYSAPWLSVDIECWERPDGSWELACVCFADSPTRVVVIPASDPNGISFIRGLCEGPSRKILQNGTFDSTVLRQNGIRLNNFAWDTMLAHHSLYTECAGGDDEVGALTKKGSKKSKAAIQKGLAFLNSIYTDIPFYKDDGKLWRETGDIEMFWRYNGYDGLVTFEVKTKQEVEIEEFGVWDTFNHEMSLVQPLMEATHTGILIDRQCHERLRRKYEGEIENLQRFLNLGAGWDVNVKSVGASGDVPKLLYDQLKIPPKTKRRANGTTTITTDKDAINELAAKHPHPLLLCILQIRERRDLIERYLNTAYDADGRMRCSFDITGTRSGRLSSRSSIFGSGTNLQNQPPDMREMFIPDPGKVFVYRDYSQAEARLVAYYARCQGLIELFEDPTRDIHRENASRIFSKPITDVDDLIERYLAKRVVHAANYGMEADKLVQVVNQDAVTTGVRLDRAMAKKLLEAYFFLYPEIKDVFWRGVERDLRATRTLVTAFGRKRIFFGRWDSTGKLVRDAYSFKPQGTVGDLGGMALVQCYNQIELGRPELGANLLLNVHDSILMQCWEKDAETVAQLMQQAMDIPITVDEYTFTIPTDCKVGYNWRDRPKKTPEDNPRGLIDLAKYPNWREVLCPGLPPIAASTSTSPEQLLTW